MRTATLEILRATREEMEAQRGHLAEPARIDRLLARWVAAIDETLAPAGRADVVDVAIVCEHGNGSPCHLGADGPFCPFEFWKPCPGNGRFEVAR